MFYVLDHAHTLAWRVASTFGIPEPHRHQEKRQAFIDAHFDEETYTVPDWGDALCGDKEVYQRLAAYYEAHAADFEDGSNWLSLRRVRDC